VVLDDRIAPKGYAYLLINGGYGTMGTVLYRDYRKSQECFKETERFFMTQMDVDIRNSRKFGGFGNFFLSDSQVQDRKMFVGESAGFQDCLWGFGMRYSILSGYLAAKTIIEGSDYDILWKRELGPMLKASLVNRVLFEKLGPFGYRHLAKKLIDMDARCYLKRFYRPSRVKKLLFPLARKIYTSRVQTDNRYQTNSTCVERSGRQRTT